jgi:hypothetical protein
MPAASNARSRAAVGITVKSGWAAAVLVVPTPESIRVCDSVRIALSDPALPEARQPYHHGFGTARATGPQLTRLVRSVRRFGGRSVAAVIARYSTAGHRWAGAGVVVGSTIDPAEIANDHIRIHALEGRLFRTIVEQAAIRAGLRCCTWRERDLYEVAARAFGRSKEQVRQQFARRPLDVSGPWRAEQKAAALAAWLMLAKTPGDRAAARSPASGARRGIGE